MSVEHPGDSPPTTGVIEHDAETASKVRVVVDVPLDAEFDYLCHGQPAPGTRVIVPFGRRKVVGMVVGPAIQGTEAPAELKWVEQVLDDVSPMPGHWMELCAFAASYYQRPLGEVMLPVLPLPLRRVSAYTGKRSAGGPVARHQRRPGRKAQAAGAADAATPQADGDSAGVTLNPAQHEAVQAIIGEPRCHLLFGVTGSGKTEVYLQAARHVLQQGRQVLFMVPEINLTPQFEAALRRRLADVVPEDGIAIMHSGLTDTQRLHAWLQVSQGRARVLLGTRMSIFVPLPEPGLIIVDEEHDASYKQQDGLRYSARDLAVWRGHRQGVPVVLGSATPSLETWHHAGSGRYGMLRLPERARAARPPAVTLVDTRRLALDRGFSPHVIKAMQATLGAGQQVLVFLNRRGFAPALHCSACGWVSQCPRCTAYAVVHRPHGGAGRSRRHQLNCHHCGYQVPVPRSCPGCGNQDMTPMGRGTQRVENELADWFEVARIVRIDADSTRLKGSAAALFQQVHDGQVDILVGTQMVSKGHDFANLGLVVVLNADTMLFSQDFRAPERLFAQLMQVAGRAGRHGGEGHVMIQTDYPEQPVYQALVAHDYPGFAAHCLQERESVGLPPFAWQALLSAEARHLADALAFLAEARALTESGPALPGADAVHLYDPVPLRVVRVANVERAQLLLESASRPALQAFLGAWRPAVNTLARRHRVRITLEVDPLEI